MDAGTPADTFLEESIGHLRHHREEMALWLALEVLQLNPVALGDTQLLDGLIACQERLEERLRAKSAVPPKQVSHE